MHRRLALAIVLLTPGTALAAPAHTGTLAVGGELAWDGGPLNGIAAVSDISDLTGCAPGIAECDDTLIKVDAAGVLTVTIAGTSAGASDLDLYVHASDAAGVDGEIVKLSAGASADETTSLDVKPGYYLVRIRAAISFAGTYKGTAKLAAPAPLPPPPGANAPPLTPANLAPTTRVNKPSGSRITVIRGTAADRDGKIARVRVGLVRLKGKACYGLTSKGTWLKLKKCTAPFLLSARGTTSWSLRLRRPLAKGKYVAYALATDDKGLREGGYGARNRVSFTVR